MRPLKLTRPGVSRPALSGTSSALITPPPEGASTTWRTETWPAQQQSPPGETAEMQPQPRDEMRNWIGRDLLAGQVALVTGGDSGIGGAVCVAFAKEGADVGIAYLSEDADAQHTAKLVEAEGRRCVLLRGDLVDRRLTVAGR